MRQNKASTEKWDLKGRKKKREVKNQIIVLKYRSSPDLSNYRKISPFCKSGNFLQSKSPVLWSWDINKEIKESRLLCAFVPDMWYKLQETEKQDSSYTLNPTLYVGNSVVLITISITIQFYISPNPKVCRKKVKGKEIYKKEIILGKFPLHNWFVFLWVFRYLFNLMGFLPIGNW